MLRSMYSGISGLRNFQTKLDVIGNNIANVNTFGYKKGRTTFKDLMSQQMQGASTPTANRGGTNPMQVGLGGAIATIDNIHTQGSMQTTGRSLDVGISGDGFFLVSDGNLNYYTRAGNFYLDVDGTLVNGDGLRVMGYRADAEGNIDYTQLQTLQIQAGSMMAPEATSKISFKGNLNADLSGTDRGGTHVLSLLRGATDTADALSQITAYLADLDTDITDAETDRDAKRDVVNDPTSGTLKNLEDAQIALEAAIASNIQADIDTALQNLSTARSAHEIAKEELRVAEVKLRTLEETKTQAINAEAKIDAAEDKNSNISVLEQSIGSMNFNDGSVYTMAQRKSALEAGKLINVKIADSLGGLHDIEFVFQKTATGTWSFGYLSKLAGADDLSVFHSINDSLSFDSKGNLIGNPIVEIEIEIDSSNGAETPIRFELDLSKMTSYAGSHTADVNTVNGNLDGYLESFNIGSSGEIVGVYSNGNVQLLGQIAVATFNNPGGLTKVANNTYQESNNSGTANVGVPGDGRGTLMGSALEMSNVDLSEEFTEMIVAQRGFQANTRIITTSDEVLQELVNLKR